MHVRSKICKSGRTKHVRFTNSYIKFRFRGSERISIIWRFFWCLQCFFSPQCVQFDLVSKYYITFIGLPVSAMGAGVLVTLLRITDGPVKLKLFVFEFE